MDVLSLEWLVICMIVFGLSMLGNALLIRYALTLGILDVPNARSSHLHVTPRSGGLAIVFAFMAGMVFLDASQIFSFLMPLFLVFGMGLWDDISSISSRIKLLITAIAGAWLFINGFEIVRFGHFFGTEIILSYGFSLAFCAFAIAGFTNALNLIDGLDGLASIVSLVILLSFAYIGFKFDDSFLFYVTTLLICAIGGFLVFNWQPAKIFMGDSGSFSIGFIIAMVVVYAIGRGYITAISTLLLAAVPILDTLIVMVRRSVKGENPLSADKTHIHHRLLKHLGGDTRKTVILIGCLQALFSYMGLGFKVRDDSIIFLLYLLSFVIFYTLLTPDKEDS